MSTIQAFFKRHPLLTFCTLTFAISWGSMLLLIGGPAALPATNDEIERFILFVYPALLAGPSVSGIFLTGMVYGRAGLRQLGSRLLRWRIGARWYVVALLTAPFVATATLLPLSLSSPDFLPRFLTTDDRAFLLQFSILSALIVAIFAELGWTGFAVPMLRQRYGVLATGLIVGLLVAAWQLPVVYWAGGDSSGALPPAVFFPAVLFSWLPAYRVLMVWVYDHTESLLAAVLMHTSLVTFWTSLTPLTIKGMPLLTYFLLYSAALWVIITAIALANRGQLTRQPPELRMA